MPSPFIRRLGLRGLLSFPPDMEPFELRPLNVLIGPNGSGKSNVIEALELLRATPTDFAAAVREGGGAEWFWKGEGSSGSAIIDAEVEVEAGLELRHFLQFSLSGGVPKVLDEEVAESQDKQNPESFYKKGHPVIKTNTIKSGNETRRERVENNNISVLDHESVLSHCRHSDFYPELAELGNKYSRIFMFREWTFGPLSELRLPQKMGSPTDRLLPDARNLSLVVQEFLHRDSKIFEEGMRHFLPRYERISPRVSDGGIQSYLHESGLRDSISMKRFSDGTLRFLAMLTALWNHVLWNQDPPPLLCLEEPELGLHPDAVSMTASLLVEASEHMQLVVTTHSDALLSALNDHVESVLVCENNGDGTTIQRLEPEELDRWLDDYTLGDLWRMGRLGANP